MEKWKIWYIQFDAEGKKIGTGFYTKEYARRGNAINVADKIYNKEREGIKFIWHVSRTNPWIKKCPFCGEEFNIGPTRYSYPLTQIVDNLANITIMVKKNGRIGYHDYFNVCPKCATKIRYLLDGMMKQEK